MRVFVIGSVRNASEEYRNKLAQHVAQLENAGHIVHLPQRDTDQTASGLEICRVNVNAIRQADEVHLFYSSDSQGTHFDMGAAFSLNKKIRVIENEEYGPGKSYARMADEWEAGVTTLININ